MTIIYTDIIIAARRWFVTASKSYKQRGNKARHQWQHCLNVELEDTPIAERNQQGCRIVQLVRHRLSVEQKNVMKLNQECHAGHQSTKSAN